MCDRWYGYLEFLPRDLHHLPLFWNAEDLKALTGTSVLEKMQSKGIQKSFHLQPPSKAGPLTQFNTLYGKAGCR